MGTISSYLDNQNAIAQVRAAQRIKAPRPLIGLPLDILYWLHKKSVQNFTTAQVAKKFPREKASNISQALGRLRARGLLSSEGRGRWRAL